MPVNKYSKYESPTYTKEGIRQDFECFIGRMVIYNDRIFIIKSFKSNYITGFQEDKKYYEVRVSDDKIPFLFTFDEAMSFLNDLKFYSESEYNRAKKDIRRVEHVLRIVKGKRILYGVNQLIIDRWIVRQGVFEIWVNNNSKKLIKNIRNAKYFTKTLKVFNEEEFLKAAAEFYSK